MKLRNVFLLILFLGVIIFAGTWGLGHLLPRAVAPKTPLTQGAIAPDADGLRRELALHPLVDPHDGRGEAAMVWAARSGRGESIALLAHAGVPVSFRDQGPNGWQPLHHAVHKGQLAAVRALLLAGAEVDGTNPDGLTPLMLAAAQGEGEIVEALLAAGANPRIAQPGGENALGYALMGGDARTVRILLARDPGLPLPAGFKTTLSRFILRLRGRSGILRLVDERRADGAPVALRSAGRGTAR